MVADIRLKLYSTVLLLGASIFAQAAGWDGPQERVQDKAIDVLASSPTGKALLEKAASFWKYKEGHGLVSHLKWGEASRTDAVLIRKLDPVTGQESREREVTIYLKKTPSLNDLVLDIAHELVHATSRPGWDPYDPLLTPGKYIWTSIEGEGGEVEAVFAECKVSSELPALQPLYVKRCGQYLEPGQKEIVRTRIRADFYRVGKWNPELQRNLGAETVMFPLLSKDSPHLYSSTGRAPYPAALYQEYKELTQLACENTARRAQAFGVRGPSRGLASEPRPTERATTDFLNQRCRPRTF